MFLPGELSAVLSPVRDQHATAYPTSAPPPLNVQSSFNAPIVKFSLTGLTASAERAILPRCSRSGCRPHAARDRGPACTIGARGGGHHVLRAFRYARGITDQNFLPT